MSEITRQEFEAEYAKKSGVTLAWLWEMGRISLPCHCEEDGCQGWQMRGLGAITDYDLQFIPEPYKSEIERRCNDRDRIMVNEHVQP